MKSGEREKLEKKLSSALRTSPAAKTLNKKRKRQLTSILRKGIVNSNLPPSTQVFLETTLLRADKKYRNWRKKSFFFRTTSLVLLVFSIWSVNLVYNYTLAWFHNSAEPDAILVLGGGPHRDILGIEAAHRYPDAIFIVSTSGAKHCTYNLVLEHGQIHSDRFILDMRASDTLTNFTSTLPILKEHSAKKVIVVTSSGHWPRANNLATVVLGSNAIAYEPYLLERDGDNESEVKTWIDTIRASLWVVFGDFIVSKQYMSPDRLIDASCHNFRMEDVENAIAVGKAKSKLPDSRN